MEKFNTYNPVSYTHLLRYKNFSLFASFMYEFGAQAYNSCLLYTSSSSLFSVICSYSNSFFLLVALSALKGFLLSGATSVSLAYISEEVLPKNKGKITGLYIAGNALGGMGGRVISSYLSTEFSWRIASVSIGVLCAIFAILFLVFSPRSCLLYTSRCV